MKNLITNIISLLFGLYIRYLIAYSEILFTKTNVIYPTDSKLVVYPSGLFSISTGIPILLMLLTFKFKNNYTGPIIWFSIGWICLEVLLKLNFVSFLIK